MTVLGLFPWVRSRPDSITVLSFVLVRPSSLGRLRVQLVNRDRVVPRLVLLRPLSISRVRRCLR